MKKLNKKGFTIVELVIVIAVIAILAGVLIPTFSSIIKKAKDSNNLQKCKNAWTEYVASLDADDFADLPTNDTIYTYEGINFTVNGASFVGLAETGASAGTLSLTNGVFTLTDATPSGD